MNDRYVEYLDSQSNFPEEAFDMQFDIDGPIEFNDNWLSNACKDDQLTALRDWFHDRYCDPVHSTPHNGREGGYLFIHGGPYSPVDELNDRFGAVVPQSVIDDIVEELEGEVGDEWAPIRRWRDFDYDEYFSDETDNNLSSKERYDINDEELYKLLKNNIISSSSNLIINMSYSMLISYLEAYLSDTVIFWAKKDDTVLYRIATKEFDNKKYSLSEILGDLDKFKETLLSHLSSNVVWHRLDKIKPFIEHGLKISMPEIKPIMQALINRHDIVHRGGVTKDGSPLIITIYDYNKLRDDIRVFIDEFHGKLNLLPSEKNDDDDDII